MLASIIIGVLIFGYAAFTLYKFMKKSKQGACAHCSLKNNCQSACNTVLKDKKVNPFSIK
ncbi:hydrolase [Heyndrickxia shackletonii]|uniref:Hydrolase n=1 Tax=Heyndrickxia shackletonii TaxID=157838 RepID=A0A0Q3TI59_9BACI|nr:FeoB-associated Cys-rich membrane protein [Heyndrickxia shackletonii]KQL53622.1 hydrolase [Heyndrickxia shackletonii]MBB2483206.1 FeoB-associated Cys-rich membrane protein [Bacillus sp. APMAM]NEZ00454.1 FeoB-associated Cys-rich membrane protein [Heyndrickxia shackletonii]RTZ53365.1 FeoB-associated Cys-rich membrane protein [Bacillus sp. SAJ1]